MSVKLVGLTATAAFTVLSVYQCVQAGQSDGVREQICRVAIAGISLQMAVALAQTIRTSVPDISLLGKNGLYAKFRERFDSNGNLIAEAIDGTFKGLGARVGQIWSAMVKEPEGTVGHPACGGGGG